MASDADDEIGDALELLWGEDVVNTCNARRVGRAAGPVDPRRADVGRRRHVDRAMTVDDR